jgi:predicted phage terminase large subunit-like protein
MTNTIPQVALKSSKYWGPPGQQHIPFGKQIAFLLLSTKEAVYGGAAGGAKSDTLLMTALQYTDVPGASALIIRRNISDLKMPGNLLDRANSWLKGHGDAKFDGSNHTYYFPTRRMNGLPGEPAKLTFGFLSKDRSLDRYQGGQFQTICFDELTQFKENEYTYLISRLRRPLCPLHGDKPSTNCGDCVQGATVPQRIRSATNPGGAGHDWVKARFDIWKGPDGRFIGHNPQRPFLPSFLEDNPFIDRKSYIESLKEQHPVIREQLLNGDWDVAEDSLFKKIWARYYHMRGHHFILEHKGIPTQSFHIGEALKVFGTIDPAVSRRQLAVKDGKKRSHCVIEIWALMPSYDLLLVGHARFQGGLEMILGHVELMNKEFRPEYFRIETNGPGEGVLQFLARNGLKMKGVATSTDKVANSIDAATRMHEGRIWLPKSAPYLEEWEGEVFTWTGDEEEQDDIVDCLSNATHEVAWDSFAQNREKNSDESASNSAVPTVYGYNGLFS